MVDGAELLAEGVELGNFLRGEGAVDYCAVVVAVKVAAIVFLADRTSTWIGHAWPSSGLIEVADMVLSIELKAELGD